ncbi:MAG TPA: adenosine deaminase [Gemmatimonadaceae bacterium]|jgi:adenosine deaminase
MAVITSELLRLLPKAELHCHLDGSVRPETLIELGREYRKAMPRDDADSLREYMRVDDAKSLEDYLARFDVTLSVMQTAESLERIAYELSIDAAREGVRYIEIRYSPVLNVKEGLSFGEAVEAPLRGLERAERDGGAMARVIICGLRHLDPQVSLELARLAVSYKHRGVVAFDLAGGELGFPASAHAAAFAHAREHDLPCTCHAGEGADASYVRDAIHLCGAHRIGHATRLIEDESLTQYVNDRRIALEICLTSNVQTKAVESYEQHPLRNYYDRGMNVVLNTDNRLMSGTTLTDEYALAARHFDFTLDDLARIALNGFESSFLPYEKREELIEKIKRDLVALGAKVAA